MSVRPVAFWGMLALLGLSGCANFSADGGRDAVAAMTLVRTGASTLPGAAVVADLLAKPLSADAAVQVALLNNRDLQASLAELGVAEADLVQAGRLRNPGFSFGRTRGGNDVEIDRAVIFDLVGLLSIPLKTKIEAARFEQAKLQAASSAVNLAIATRRAYFNAVAAQQTDRFMAQVQESADASAELARRMARVGNWSKLEASREQLFYAETTAQLARARHNVVAAREQLTRSLGLWGSELNYVLPDRLPELPATLKSMNDVEAQAMQQRLDVQMMRREAQSSAGALGLTKASRFINVLHAGYTNRSETDKARVNGYEVELELPLFDWSGANIAKAESLYMQSVHRTAATAIRARSEVRESYSAYRTSYDLARHYRDEIVPLRKRISEEMLLRYNGMLASVFDLLADAREQVQGVNASIEAQRDYWLAETDLQMAINGNGGSALQLQGKAPVQGKEH
jgi:outer membrane protein TolC